LKNNHDEDRLTVALPINSEEVERLAYEIAAYTGESVPDAIRNALRERLDRQKARGKRASSLRPQLQEIRKRCAALPRLDQRTADEILGYDSVGLPR
jgi:antitoxin VapB